MSSNSDHRLRVGILGCAAIAKKNAIAMLQEPSGCCVAGVASRSPEKASAFCDFVKSQFTTSSSTRESYDVTCYSSYDDLIQDSTIDAVYIPLPTTLHKTWVLKALQAGKHVLLEKPVAGSAEEYQEMQSAAIKHNKYLQDGTMFAHHPRTQAFVETVQDPSIMGQLTRIEAGFSFCGDDGFFKDNVRIKKDCDLFGCLGDLGWYVLRMALLVVGKDDRQVMTSAQVVDCQLNDDGVPIDATVLIQFHDHDDNNNNSKPITLSFHCGFQTQFRQYVHVAGTKAWAFMNDFVLPQKHPIQFRVESMNLTEFDLITEHACQTKEFEGPVQEVLMWQTFARCATEIDSSPKGWQGDTHKCREALKLSQISLANQKLLDSLMTSLRSGGAKASVSADMMQIVKRNSVQGSKLTSCRIVSDVS